MLKIECAFFIFRYLAIFDFFKLISDLIIVLPQLRLFYFIYFSFLQF